MMNTMTMMMKMMMIYIHKDTNNIIREIK